MAKHDLNFVWDQQKTFLTKQNTSGINLPRMLTEQFLRPVSGKAKDGSQLIKLLIVDCKGSMWDSCGRGCDAGLKQGWLLIIPGKCCSRSGLVTFMVTPPSSCAPTIYSLTHTVNRRSSLNTSWLDNFWYLSPAFGANWWMIRYFYPLSFLLC